MIEIGKPYIFTRDGRAWLKAPVRIPEATAQRYIKIAPAHPNCVWLTGTDYPPEVWRKEDSGLWFNVPEAFGEYLCAERSNAFVVALLWYALVTETDIRFEAPLSKKLYEGITGGLFPALEKKGYRPIRLTGPLSAEPVLRKKGVITGMSCGVDSLYTLKTYKDKSGDDRLSYLSYYDISFLFPPKGSRTDIDRIYAAEAAKSAEIISFAKTIAAHNGLPFIDVRSNLDRDYMRGGYNFTAMYRFPACSMALEPMLHKYISSSSGHGGSLSTDLFAPSQHYEDLLVSCFRTESFSYENSDNTLRIDKIRALADDADFQRYVSVCFNKRNCGACYGCWKTMFPLDIMGKLGAFGESFDLEKYERTKEKQFADFFAFTKLPESESARELLKQLLTLAGQERTPAAGLFLEVYKKSFPSSPENGAD